MAEKIKVTFLGTGGMIPTEKRNHPAFFLSCGNEGILVDCGEATQLQFRKAGISMNRITRILLTHRHGDHTFGLPGLFRTLAMNGYKKTLFIYGPKGIRKTISGIFEAFGSTTEYEIKVNEVLGKFFENNDFFLEAERMVHGPLCNAYSFVLKGRTRIDKKKLKKLGIKPGRHLSDLKKSGHIIYNGKKYAAKNLVFNEEEKKVSFVMDTSMNDRIVPFVKNADLLVCEAGFGDEISKKAGDYMHLTSGQAGEIAKKAKVKKLYLAHISERYENSSDVLLAQARKHFRNTHIPKDMDTAEI
jgi:ribonuclease Z